jgi:tetratricopeptide (TPR) repeat protein
MKNLSRILTTVFFIFCSSFLSTATHAIPLAIYSFQDDQNSKYMELLRAGITFYQQQKIEEAIASLQKASALKPNEYRPFGLIGICYMSQLKYKSASESFAKAIALQPNDVKLYIMKANVDSGRNAIEDGLTACRKAIEVDPNYAEAYVMMGDILKRDERRHSEAISVYQKAIKINPALMAPYLPLGEIQTFAKDEKGAEITYRQAMEADPKKMVGCFPLGRILVTQGRLIEARELWNGKTSDHDSTMPTFIEVLERAERLKQATDVLAKSPKNPEAVVNMGIAVMDGDSWVMDSRHEKARGYFIEALKIKPGFAKAQYGICKSYIQVKFMNPAMKKLADQELEKLRKIDKALAGELVAYRKNSAGGIPGGIVGSPVDLNK